MSRNRPKTPLDCALRYLGFRSRTAFEVRQKLVTSGFSEEDVTTTLEQLRSRNLVNDESLAQDWTRSKTAERGYGPLLVERELGRRGLAPPLVDRILAETFGDGQELERAAELVERQFGASDLSDPKILKRAESLLLRRGYHHSVIVEVLGANLEQVES